MIPLLLILSVVGFGIAWIVYYASRPETKYKEATELISRKKYEEGRKMLQTLYGKHPDAPVKMAESYLLAGIRESDKLVARELFLKVFDDKNEITHAESSQKYNRFEARAIFEIATIDLELAKSEPDEQEKISKIKTNLEFLLTTAAESPSKAFIALQNEHYNELTKAYVKTGNDAERTGRVNEALSIYATAMMYAKYAVDNTLEAAISIRIAICNLKLNQTFNQDIFTKIGNADLKLQNDFYFRYAKRLATNGNYAKAEKLLKTNFDAGNAAATKLLAYLQQQKVQHALSEIERVNSVLLNSKPHSSQELSVLYFQFDQSLRYISNIIPSVSEKVKQFKPILFKRLLAAYMDTGQFSEALNIIKQYPTFWNHHDILRNAAICCFQIAIDGLLTPNNYKEVISIWLTAVFCNDTVLNLLETVGWNSEFTFTLSGAIGATTGSTDLAIDINFDPPSEKNISIGDTQRELVSKFEGIFSELPSDKLRHDIADFYAKEKSTIQEILRITEKKNIFLATPHFALSNNISPTIINAIDEKYSETKDESMLAIGTQYLKTPDDTVVGSYLTATNIIADFLKHTEAENLAILQIINTPENKKTLSSFPKLLASVEEKILQCLEKRILLNEFNEQLIPIMEEAINFSARNDNLKYQYCIFVTNYCIEKINASALENYKGLVLLTNAYFFSPNMPKLCENLITIIHFNLRDIKNSETTETENIYPILDRILEKKSPVFKEFSHELLEIRERMLSQIEKAGLPSHLFLGQFNGNLNSFGLELKKVLQYYKKLGEN
jgi:tetratricopeptide (TPR) repeat protein